MRLLTFRTPDGTRAGRVDGNEVTELESPDIGALLESSESPESTLARVADAAGPVHALDALELAPIVIRPSKVICLGLNYRAHIMETLREVPAYPTLFAKFGEALIGARDDIILPSLATQPDWEVELALVIGRRVRHADHDEAAAAIAGYTVCNDITMRDWQRRTLQWLQGKTWEGTTPVGPVLVTPDEIDHAADLALRCEVDGEVVQSARTSDMVFKPAEIVAYISEIITLQPGDLISTGTPGGIGEARDPQVFLRPGQIVRTSIEGIGELVNRCVAAP
jgi:acylpyruvate hydrolase